jgi:hypothetical protein
MESGWHHSAVWKSFAMGVSASNPDTGGYAQYSVIRRVLYWMIPKGFFPVQDSGVIKW